MITEVMSSSAHAGGSNNADWFELTNTGAAAVSIAGWSWDDDSATAGSANFGTVTSIAPGQSVIITGETTGAEATWLSNWGLSGVTVFNLDNAFQNFSANGDMLNIYDASNALVTSVTFGLATTGASFEWNTSGGSLGVSVAGENGAFVAASNGQNTGLGPGTDVGSPGTAVPETSTALLGLVAVAGFIRRRRA